MEAKLYGNSKFYFLHNKSINSHNKYKSTYVYINPHVKMNLTDPDWQNSKSLFVSNRVNSGKLYTFLFAVECNIRNVMDKSIWQYQQIVIRSSLSNLCHGLELGITWRNNEWMIYLIAFRPCIYQRDVFRLGYLRYLNVDLDKIP
jgi:hypothetical protein